jgi:hypothetical protein
MSKKTIPLVFIPVLLIHITGCYSSGIVTKESLGTLKKNKINLVTNDGKEYEGKSNQWFVTNDTLVIGGYNFSEGKVIQQKIPFIDIKEVYADKYDSERTILLLSPLIAAAVLILIFIGIHNHSY